MLQIIKRDGRKVDFNEKKIEEAILKAFIDIDGVPSEYAKNKAKNIADYISNYAQKENKQLKVEEIQDLVENGLMSTKRKDVAKAYINYREKRNKIR